MNFQKKFGGITIRKVESEISKIQQLELLLARRKLKVLGGTSSAGLNYTLLTALSIGCNYAYVQVPWSQAINLTLQEARDLAVDTLAMHADTVYAVISLAMVSGTTKQQSREYYVVTPDFLWELSGTKSSLHSYVETHTREGISGDQTTAENTVGNTVRNTGRNTGSGEPIRSSGDEGRRLRTDSEKGRSGKDTGVPRTARTKRSGPRKGR